MRIVTSPRSSRHDACSDPVIGAILSGWRYDISGIPKDLRGDYDLHLHDCTYCQRRQRLHRTVDVLLLAVTTLSFAAFLLAALVMHKVEAYTHVMSLHVHLHSETATELHMIPDSIAISLETVACVGVFISLLLWILVAIATPVPGMLSSMFRQRVSARQGETGDSLQKRAA
jgi:predicted metal-binding membrane protein